MAEIVSYGDFRWPHLIAAPPQFHVCLTEFGDGFRFIEPLKPAIVALIQAPTRLSRYPHEIHLIHDNPKGSNRTLQNRSIGDIKCKAMFAEDLASSPSLIESFRGKIDIGPTSKPVLAVPDALSVA